MRALGLASCLLVGLLGVACGGSSVTTSSNAGGNGQGGTSQGGGGQSTGGAGGQAPASDLPCDVADFFAARCGECHSSPTKFGAPMPLVTVADLAAPAISDSSVTVLAKVLERIQTDVQDDVMPPPPREQATAAEIATLEAWQAAGLPPRAAGESCGGGGGGGGAGGGGLDCVPDVQVGPTGSFTMPQDAADEYVCYGFDLPAESVKRYITAIAPRIDNETITHHMLLYVSPDPVGSAPVSCSSAPDLGWKLYYGWAPGTGPHVLPADVGFPLDADEPVHFVVQMHYNNFQHLAGEEDASGIDLCTTTEALQHDADVLAVGGTNFELPANATSTLTCDLPIVSQLSFITPLNVFQSWPHMHQLGRKLKTTIEHDDGSETLVVDSQAYSFENQIAYPVTAQINTGDNVRTLCMFENDTGMDVGFGENTGDEMCFNFLAYYPKINLAQWSWLIPAELGQCSVADGGF